MVDKKLSGLEEVRPKYVYVNHNFNARSKRVKKPKTVVSTQNPK